MRDTLTKWPTGYDRDLSLSLSLAPLYLSRYFDYSLFLGGGHYIMHYYDICVRDGFAVFVVVVSLLFFVSLDIFSYFILFKLLIKGFRQRLSQRRLSVQIQVQSQIPSQRRLLFASAFIIYANFLCTVLQQIRLLFVSRFPLNAPKKRKKYIHSNIYDIKKQSNNNNKKN